MKTETSHFYALEQEDSGFLKFELYTIGNDYTYSCSCFYSDADLENALILIDPSLDKLSDAQKFITIKLITHYLGNHREPDINKHHASEKFDRMLSNARAIKFVKGEHGFKIIELHSHDMIDKPVTFKNNEGKEIDTFDSLQSLAETVSKAEPPHFESLHLESPHFIIDLDLEAEMSKQKSVATNEPVQEK